MIHAYLLLSLFLVSYNLSPLYMYTSPTTWVYNLSLVCRRLGPLILRLCFLYPAVSKRKPQAFVLEAS
jgi:hypothetical protein